MQNRVFITVVSKFPRHFNGTMRSIIIRHKLCTEYMDSEHYILYIGDNKERFYNIKSEGYIPQSIDLLDCTDVIECLNKHTDDCKIYFIVEGYYCEVYDVLDKLKHDIKQSHVKILVVQDTIKNYHNITDNNHSNIDGLIYLSEEIKNKAMQRMPLFKRFKSFVIPHMKPKSPVYRGLENRNRYNIIMLGTVCNRKNYIVAAQIMRGIVKELPEVKLNIYGSIGVTVEDQIYHDLLKVFIAREGLQDNISINNSITNVNGVLQKSVLAINLSKFEGLPFWILEAISAGLPVIHMDADTYSLLPFIDEGKNGYIVNCQKCFSDHILDLLLNERKWSEFSLHSYNKSKDFSGRAIADKWEEMLIELWA